MRRISTSFSSSSRTSLSSSSSNEKREIKKKPNRRKKKGSVPIQGTESDRSDKMENQQSSKRFTISNQEDQFRWVLPDDMAKYANSHF